MPSGDDRVPLDVLRAAARERAESSSLRQLAGDIGMDHHALSRFIHGGTPYGMNVKRLRRWYAEEENEVIRLRNENADLRKRLAECEGKLKKGG